MTTSATNPAVPLRHGSRADFSRIRSLLREVEYDEGTICRTIGIDSMADLARARPEDLDRAVGDSAPLSLLIKIFLFGQPVLPAELDRKLGATARNALVALDLVRLGPVREDAERDGVAYYSPVLLYPVGGVLIASDRYDKPDLSPLKPPADIVFPAIFSGTLRFLRILGRSPAEEVLDLCSGTGIGALALSREARQVVAADLTARAGHFARFNGLLNSCDNLEVVQGDLYEPVRGRTFDRIIAHPPYVPALAPAQIYRDAGEAGEHIIRRIVEGLPGFLRPGGTFYAVSAGWDSADGPFEQRMRRWLGDRSDEFDVIFAEHEAQSREQVARWLDEKARATSGEIALGWEQRFRDARLERHIYGALVLRRRFADEPGAPVTARPRLSHETDGACFEWALRWFTWRRTREAAGTLSQTLLDATHRLAPSLRVALRYAPREGQLEPKQVVLETERPFRAATTIEPWMLGVVSAFGAGRSGRAVHEALHQAGAVPPEFQLDHLAALLEMLIERGYLESDLPLP
ncbi:MAG TPA: class I SAM-dependent methyltransferase [Gemmatimonadales bacterium]|nr:class I SAM-dependent methyltransferase [Gemmatimonadales bacterium]